MTWLLKFAAAAHGPKDTTAKVTTTPRDQENVTASEAEDGFDIEDNRSWATEDSQREQSHVDSGQESEAHDSSIEEIEQVEADDATERAAKAEAVLNETARKKRKEAPSAKRAEKEARDQAVKRATKREDKKK